MFCRIDNEVQVDSSCSAAHHHGAGHGAYFFLSSYFFFLLIISILVSSSLPLHSHLVAIKVVILKKERTNLWGELNNSFSNLTWLIHLGRLILECDAISSSHVAKFLITSWNLLCILQWFGNLKLISSSHVGLLSVH